MDPSLQRRSLRQRPTRSPRQSVYKAAVKAPRIHADTAPALLPRSESLRRKTHEKLAALSETSACRGNSTVM